MKAPLFLFLLTGCLAVKPSERIQFEAQDVYPEGITYDSKNDMFFVSSMRTGTIGKVSRKGDYMPLIVDSNFKSSYGMKMHPGGKQLYVCVGDANYSKYTSAFTRKKKSQLIIINTDNGNDVTEVDLSNLVPGNHFPNDLAFDDKGNAFITDSYANAIYKVTPDKKASLFTNDKKFKTEGIGLNGIVFHPNGFLLVNSSATGRIYKVDINNPSNINLVDINQYFLGADGMLLSDSSHLTIVVNGGNDKIFELKSTDNWHSAELAATTLAVDRFTYPSTATLSGSDIWIMNAKTNELMDSNAIPAKFFAIQRAILKPIPKKFRK